MDPAKYEFQSDFARHFIALGKAAGGAQGQQSGRAALVMRQLIVKFGASIAELDKIGERLLTAASLSEAMGGSR